MSSNTSALAWSRVRYVLFAVRSVFNEEKKLYARRPNIAVLMLTNNAQRRLHEIAIQNGACACVVKRFLRKIYTGPSNRSEFRLCISRLPVDTIHERKTEIGPPRSVALETRTRWHPSDRQGSKE